ncbi:MAG: V-type ATP synthase subunit A [Chloroflexota bacterium]
MATDREGPAPSVVATISAVDGPVVSIEGAERIGMLELVQVGEQRLLGEVIRLEGGEGTVQVYEDTSGLGPGMPVYGTGMPLSAELGPGLLGQVFDGVQRPLEVIKEQAGVFVQRGVLIPALDRSRRWPLEMRVKVGDRLAGGAVVGVVQETELIEHRVLLPPGLSGQVTWVAPGGEYAVEEPIARVASDSGEREIAMFQRWPVRTRRPYRERLLPNVPLVTGQRVIDTFFPLAKGGTAAIPGGFGTGKTVTQHQLAKWSDANVIVYVGCGERGNEMTDVLRDFPKLLDPHTGKPLMQRTVLVANTSNMPVAAREASIYTGITMAEYFRDMGYHVAIMADSTSRWAEALREIAGRLEEMPAEEGYPAYLPSRLAGFYERAGRVTTLSDQEGSVAAIGAVSPPGGAFTEPVTSHTQRFVRAFWALDRDLASARHFPSINWMDSYSQYVDEVEGWWKANVDPEWRPQRDAAMSLLHEEDRLQQIARLVGPDALPDQQRLVLLSARLIREGFLQQNALDEVDSYTTPERQDAMLRAILRFHSRGSRLIALGVPILRLSSLPVVDSLLRMRRTIPNEAVARVAQIEQDIDRQIHEIELEYVQAA